MSKMKRVEDPFHSAIRLCSAVDLLKHNWNQSKGIQPDIIRDYEGVQAWIWIPNLYECVEQMFKLMIQTTSESNEYPLGHRLRDLFKSLSNDHRDSLSNCFASFLKTHPQIDVSTLDEFLNLVDSGKNGESGYVSWRYFLLEGLPQNQEEVPTQSVDAMLEIALMCSIILRREVILKKPSGRLETLQVRMGKKLYNAVRSAANRYTAQENVQRELLSSGKSLEIFIDIDQSLWTLVRENLQYFLTYLCNDQFQVKDDQAIYLAPLLWHLPEKDRMWINHIAKSLETDRQSFIQYFSGILNGSYKLANVTYPIAQDNKPAYTTLNC